MICPFSALRAFGGAGHRRADRASCAAGKARGGRAQHSGPAGGVRGHAAGGRGLYPCLAVFFPLSIYYTLGLGLGLLAVYLLLRGAELELPRSYDLLCRLMQLLYTIGLAMVLAVGELLPAPLA